MQTATLFWCCVKHCLSCKLMAKLHCSFMLVLKGLKYGTTRHLHCKFLMVTHGILAHQYTPEVRGDMSGQHLFSCAQWRMGCFIVKDVTAKRYVPALWRKASHYPDLESCSDSCPVNVSSSDGAKP